MINRRSDAYAAMNAHMRAHDPFERAKTETVTVEVHSVLPMSPQTWRVEWREDPKTRRHRARLDRNAGHHHARVQRARRRGDAATEPERSLRERLQLGGAAVMRQFSARALLLPAILFAANPLFTAGLAYGQAVPPREPVEKRFDPPPRVPLFSGPDARLTPKEQKGIAFGRDWAGNRDMPARGDAGATVFVFGSTCPPLSARRSSSATSRSSRAKA